MDRRNADAFDAMTNDRVYRKAMTVDEAVLEIRRNTGKQFDPRAAQLFLEIIASTPEPEGV